MKVLTLEVTEEVIKRTGMVFGKRGRLNNKSKYLGALSYVVQDVEKLGQDDVKKYTFPEDMACKKFLWALTKFVKRHKLKIGISHTKCVVYVYKQEVEK